MHKDPYFISKDDRTLHYLVTKARQRIHISSLSLTISKSTS